MNNRFKSAVQRIQEMEQQGVAAAQTNRDAGELSRDEKALLEKGAKMGDQGSAEALAEIDKAWDTVQNDPFARQANLRLAIADFGTHALPDSERFLKLYYASSAKRINGGKLALPNLETKRRETLKHGERVLYFPFASNKNGVMHVSLHRLPVGAAENADIPTLQSMVRQYNRLRRRTLEDFFDTAGYLQNPRDAAWQAAVFMSDTAILPLRVSGEERKRGDRRDSINEKFDVFDAEPLIYERKGAGTYYHAYQLSEAEVFLVSDKNRDAERVVGKIRELAATWKIFWSDDEEINLTTLIESYLGDNSTKVVSPEEFLSGTPGLVAVRHEEWRAGKQTVPVEILFERLGEEWGHAWRWSLCNRDAVDAIFGGRALKFHSWSRGAIPGFLENLLRLGQPVTVPLNTLPLDRVEEAAG